MCSTTPTSMSDIDSGSPQQFPNPKEEITIKEPLSLSKESSVLTHTKKNKNLSTFIEIRDSKCEPEV